MRESWFGGLGAATALLALMVEGAARAAPLADPASFGTGVNSSNTPLGVSEALATVTPLHTLSDELFSFPPSTALGAARASANLQGFELGVGGVSDEAEGQTRAGAVAYTGMTVVGDAPPRLPGSFHLEGDFTGFPSQLNLYVWDLHGTLLAELSANAQAAGTVWSADYDPTPDDRTNFDGVCFNCPDPSGPPVVAWPGSFTLPFVVPLGSDTGIVVELWTGVFLGDALRTVEFLDTATLSFVPPPDVEVILATGQRFVPEPGSPILVATGLAVWAATRSRRRPAPGGCR